MFEQRQREIYSYLNGRRLVYADPLELQRKVRRAAGEDPAKLAQQASAAYPGAIGEPPPELSAEAFAAASEAEDKLIAAVRAAVGMKFDDATGEGATFSDGQGVLNDFCRRLDQK